MAQTWEPRNRAQDVNAANQAYADQLCAFLPTATFKQAVKAYYTMLTDTNVAKSVVAQVGRSDRFFLFSMILRRSDGLHPWVYDQCREVEKDPDGHLDLWSREHYKDLACDTKVITNNRGIINHGDLVPGDEVFTWDGNVSRVVATKHFNDSKCYKITFCNNIEIIAGSGHLWNVQVPSKKRVPGTFKKGVSCGKRITRETKLLETCELYNYIKGTEYRVGINVTSPIDNQDSDLPIDPYVLGVWLGDGFSKCATICGIDKQIFDEIERRGYSFLPDRKKDISRHPDYRAATIVGLAKQLVKLGLIGNKHIPTQYLTASLEQRLDLLRGLMDTDGNIASNKNSTATFSQKSLTITKQFRILANSLGYKARITPARSTNSWHVTFQINHNDKFYPCLLDRKLSLIKKNVIRHRSSKSWYINSIEECDTVPTNCIQIEDKCGMYLVGEELIPTHNSSLITFAGSIQEIIKDPEITIGIFSHTKKIARDFVSQIKRECEDNPNLFKYYPDIFWRNPARESKSWSLDGGLIFKRKTNPRCATVEGWGLVDGQPIGKHFSLMVYDDVVTEESVNTAEMILKTNKMWELSRSLSAQTQDNTARRTWYIGTRYDFSDTYGEILKRKVAIPRIHPATDDGSPDGKPVFFTQEDWDEKKRENSAYVLACQYLQNPLAGSQQEFKPEWIRRYEVRPKTLNVYIMCDPAGSEIKDNNCNTAFAVVGVDSALNKYLLDGCCHKMTLSEKWTMLKSLRIKWMNQFGVQMVKIGYERYGMQADIQHFEEMMKIENNFFKIEELNWPRVGSHSKDARIRRLIPDHQNWRFFYPYDGQETSAQKKAREFGRSALIARPIKRANENKRVYDLVNWFITNEYTYFPATKLKDFLDCLSRIYDMEVTPPSSAEDKMVLPEYAGDY
jgi:hypothetical protein